MNNIEFEETLFKMRMDLYRHPQRDVIEEGFRPVSGAVADFCAIEHEGRHHFFYIERRLQEGTPFYPGNEIYFGHSSTANFVDWEVHNPVMLIDPNSTWECGHVWAPFILKRGDTYVMAYTGLNYECSQDIGLAFSKDLFNWTRWEGNPISPCKDKAWAAWWPDRISSCRDPHMFERDGRVWMAFTANTARGETCIALTSSEDLVHWDDHGPILVGPDEGYEPRLSGGHPQGSLESSNLLEKNGKWYLIVNMATRNTTTRHWIYESDRMDRFEYGTGREFWRDGGCIEIVKERGSEALVAGVGRGIRFGVVDWSDPQPTVRTIQDVEELRGWGP